VIYQILEQGSFELPKPIWKDLYLGTKKVSREGRRPSSSRAFQFGKKAENDAKDQRL
jgi:hypothetical protein